MTLRQMEHFLEMASRGSINGAAAKLGLNQQSLQASLNALEKSLGFSLFFRSRAGLALTPRGEEILPEVAQVVGLAQGWLRLRDEDERRIIRIVGTVTLINRVTDRLALYFKEKYPKVALELIEAHRQVVLESVRREGGIAIFGSVPPEEIGYAREQLKKCCCEMEVLEEDDYAVFLNSSHPLARGSSLNLGQLAQFTAALYPRDDKKFCYSEVYRFFSSKTRPHYATRQENLLKLVARDASVAAVFPQSAIHNPNIAPGSVVALPVADFPMPGLNCMAYPRREMLSAIERELVARLPAICMRQSKDIFKTRESG